MGRTVEERRAYQREYMRRRRRDRPDVREAERLRSREVYRADPIAGRAVSARWRRAHPDSVRDINARRSPESRQAGWQRFYESNAEAMRERSRRRRATHPEDKRRSQALRKARRRSAIVTLTARDVEAIRAQPCRRCGASGPNTLAHDIPVSRGGGTTRENCFSLCGPCNSRMNTKTWEEFTRGVA